MGITISFNPEDSKYKYSQEFSDSNNVEVNPNEMNIWNNNETKISDDISIGEALQAGTDNARNSDVLELSSAKASAPVQAAGFQDNTIRLDKLIVNGEVNRTELARTEKIIAMQGNPVYQNAEMDFTMAVIAKNRNYFYGNHDANKLMEAWNFVKENVGKNIDFSENEMYKNFAPAEQKIIQDSFREITGKDIDFNSKTELIPQERYKILSEYANLFE